MLDPLGIAATVGAADDFVSPAATCPFCPVGTVEAIGALEGAAATDVESAPEDDPETAPAGASSGCPLDPGVTDSFDAETGGCSAVPFPSLVDSIPVTGKFAAGAKEAKD